MPEESTNSQLPQGWEDTWKAAIKARENANAPYSGFRVGAALKLEDEDQIFTGCNVENASYGATMCAERNAVFQMVAATGGARRGDFLVLVTDTKDPTVPCALCLQVMAEFFTPNLEICLANLEGIQEQVALGRLLPRPFTDFDPSST
jgi:homotetrameric cytidine deaminase